MSLSYLDANGEQQELPLSEVEAKCEEGVLEDSTQVRCWVFAQHNAPFGAAPDRQLANCGARRCGSKGWMVGPSLATRRSSSWKRWSKA